jgi:hypothetical protein
VLGDSEPHEDHVTDDGRLRQTAREAILAGRLPAGRPDRTWGGPGAGARCTICQVAVTRDEPELELEFARQGGAARGWDTYHVHARCFTAWQLERKRLTPLGAPGRGFLSERPDGGNIDGRERARRDDPGPA